MCLVASSLFICGTDIRITRNCHNDLFDSVFVEYIDEKWSGDGSSILPSDPYDRAVARFWAAYFDDKVVPVIFKLSFGPESERVALIEQTAEGLVPLEEAFKTCSKGKSYFGGDNIGYTDIALGSFIGWIKAIEKMSGIKVLAEAKTPGLVGWVTKFLSTDAAKKFVPEPEVPNTLYPHPQILTPLSHFHHKTIKTNSNGRWAQNIPRWGQWQWKRMQAKKAKQLHKARLARERQIYELRKRAELKAAVSELERPWEVVEKAPKLFSASADEQVQVLADRFQKPGGFDLWSEKDGPELFKTVDGFLSARFFLKGVVHSIRPYERVNEEIDEFRGLGNEKRVNIGSLDRVSDGIDEFGGLGGVKGVKTGSFDEYVKKRNLLNEGSKGKVRKKRNGRSTADATSVSQGRNVEKQCITNFSKDIVVLPSQCDDQNWPFAKTNYSLWNSLESEEAFRLVPQTPHFQSLFSQRESSREGAAIASMVNFSNVFKMASNLQPDCPRNTIEDALETLLDLENDGFMVNVVRDRFLQLLSAKDKVEGFVAKAKETTDQIEEIDHDQSMIDLNIKDIQNRIRLLQEECALALSKKAEQYSTIAHLKSKVSGLNDSIRNAELEFTALVATPWQV
ncbi:hypothetical protein ACET3Z_017490 [Daucus carota]